MMAESAHWSERFKNAMEANHGFLTTSKAGYSFQILLLMGELKGLKGLRVKGSASKGNTNITRDPGIKAFHQAVSSDLNTRS